MTAIPTYLCFPYINEQNVLYRTSEGRTLSYNQPGYRLKEQEKVIFDNVEGFDVYPFNTHSVADITSVEMKLKDVEMNISKNEIICNKPICIEVCVDKLYVWNTDCEENRSLTTKGGSVVNGYNLLCFNGGRKKVTRNFDYMRWSLSNLNLSNFTFKGNGSNLTISGDCFKDFCTVKIFGKNNVKLMPNNYNFIDLYSTHNNVDFTDSNCEIIKIEMEGNGTIHGLKVDKKASVKLVGNGTVYLKTNENTIIEKEVYGVGKIITI